MPIFLKTHKMLWGRAANRCAICTAELALDTSEGEGSNIGAECHIVAKSQDGPRGDSSLSPEQRDDYSNLILLCANHHKLVDDQPSMYTVEHLQEKKALHERWVTEKLGINKEKQFDDEIYAGYVDEFSSRMQLDNWQAWMSSLLSHGQPQISVEKLNALRDIRPWIMGRIWPGRYPSLESAFHNFRFVADDLCAEFSRHSESFGEDTLTTKKFYKIDEWNQEKYDRLSKRFDDHVDLVEDLTLELTRAANYICDKVRESLERSYRIREGVLLVQSGPHLDLSYATHRTEYRGEERTSTPYPGLEAFKKETRFKRDFCFGSQSGDE